MQHRFSFAVAVGYFLLTACGSDNFGVATDDTDLTVEASGGTTPEMGSGGSGDGDDASGGNGSNTASGGVDQGSGGVEEDGVLRGPKLSDVDTTLGGMNGDLPAPASCPQFPQSMCVEMTGLVNGKAITASCIPESFENDAGNVSCQGEGMGLGLMLQAFSGAPPSSFNFTSDPQQHPMSFEWHDAGFATHKMGVYAVAETHEFAFRTTGVAYEEEMPDESRLPYLAGTFSVTWTKRPTCPACADVRLLGNFSVYTGP